MTAGTRVIARPTLRGRRAAAALAVMFGIGVLTGLAVPLVPRLAQGTTTTTAVAAQPVPNLAADRAYRAGERGDVPVVSVVGDQAWLMYRAGERGDPAR